MSVVIAHIEEDTAAAERIEAALKRAGIKVWRTGATRPGDSEIVEPGRRINADWDAIVCVSRLAVGSGLLHRVANAVQSRRERGADVRAVPALLEDVYTDALPPALDGKRVDCRGTASDAGLQELVATFATADTGVAADAVYRYVSRLRAHCATLPVAGFETSVRTPLKLEKVYVPLLARVSHHAMDLEHPAAGSFGHLCALDAAGDDASAPQPFDEAFALAARHEFEGLAVIGNPGSGKSTLLKHFVLVCADPDGGPQRLGLPRDAVPVLVPLRSVTRPADGLLACVTDAVKQIDPAADPLALARELIGRPHLLLMVDGLDEVRTQTDREAVSRWIETATTQLQQSRIVVTSRYAPYRGDTRLDGRFLELHVRPLGEDAIRRCVRAWYQTVEAKADLGRDPEVSRDIATRQADDLLQRLFDGDDARGEGPRKLAETPLMLQVICLVHRANNTLPKRRVRLYAEAVRVLVEKWKKAEKAQLDYEPDEAMRLLEPLAWWMHEQGLEEARGEAILDRLSQPLRDLKRSREEGRLLLDRLRDQSGILVWVGADTFAFQHLELQAFLAASHVKSVALSRAETLATLASHFADDRWREVILLAVGLDSPPLFDPLLRSVIDQDLLSANPQLANDLLRDASVPTPQPLIEALARGIADADTRYHALRLLIAIDPTPDLERAVSTPGAGDRPLAALLRDLAEGDSSREVQALARQLLGGAPTRAGAAGYTVTGAAREWVNERDGSVMIEIPEGDYRLGSDRLDASLPREFRQAATPVHTVHLSAYALARYPVTNAQYELFLRASPGTSKPRYWDDDRFSQPEQPVVGVTWAEASAYAAWAGLQLPSEAQWEAAARGNDERAFPWGNEPPDATRANFGGALDRTAPVGSYPSGAGPFGTMDQAGNVWEWSADRWVPEAYKARDGAVDPAERGVDNVDKVAFVLRGGSWHDPAEYLAAAVRHGNPGWSRCRDIGFRCALSSSSPSTVR